jgi:hypothetical protein
MASTARARGSYSASTIGVPNASADRGPERDGDARAEHGELAAVEGLGHLGGSAPAAQIDAHQGDRPAQVTAGLLGGDGGEEVLEAVEVGAVGRPRARPSRSATAMAETNMAPTRAPPVGSWGVSMTTRS